jgi:response regulator of citrate/malate metabolism
MTKKIMIIEDDRACEMILRQVIQSLEGDAVIDCEESAERAALAIDKKANEGRNYDLVIADIFLSGQRTGLEFYQNCREKFPDVPILIISSLAPQRFFESIGRHSIAPPFLEKPFYIGECRQLIEGLLSYN